jgi:hypothetical protein
VADTRRNSKRETKTRAQRVLEKEGFNPKDIRWYRSDEPHIAVFDQVKRIGIQTRGRRRQDLYLACLYDDAELAALIGGSQAIGEFTPQTMVTNLVKRQCDAFVAKESKNRPVPMALTTGGDWGQQRRAKSLSKFFEGVLDSVKFWDTRPLRLRDGSVFGSGLAHNYRVGRRLVHERVYPWEVRVDPREAQYRTPRSLYVRRFVDRLVLMERFPKFAELIAKADTRTDEDAWDIGYDETSDLVLVVEAWHLPSGELDDDKKASDGAHAICVSNATLEITEYRRDYFPFSKWDFSPGLIGWWGEGMAKQIAPLQFEANSIGLRLQEQGYMTGSYVWVKSGSNLEVDHLDNGTLTVLESDQKPEFFTPNPWHPQFFDYYMALRGRFAAEETRISEMATRGEKPAGLDSGKAIRAWNDLDSEAFLPQGHESERDTIDTSWQLFDLAEEIYAEAGDEKDERKAYSVRIEQREHGKSALEDVKYADVRMDRDAFTLRVFPTGFLKGTPAEKYQSIKEVMQDGLLSQDEALTLLDFPDLDRVLSLRGAARRCVEKILQKILDADDPEAAYEYPEPPMNLELCRALALMTYLDARTNEAPEENLRWVLQFALDAEEEIERAAQGLPPGGPNGAPPGPGAPPPPGDAGPLLAEPTEQPLPANAIAPEAMPNLPPQV